MDLEDNESLYSLVPPMNKDFGKNRKAAKTAEGQASAVRFLESSSQFGNSTQPKQGDDCKQQKQNLKVIQRILEMFDLEETKRKYETQNVLEYVLDPNDFGYDW